MGEKLLDDFVVLLGLQIIIFIRCLLEDIAILRAAQLPQTNKHTDLDNNHLQQASLMMNAGDGCF